MGADKPVEIKIKKIAYPYGIKFESDGITINKIDKKKVDKKVYDPLSKAGATKGWILLTIGGKPIKTKDDAKKQGKSSKSGAKTVFAPPKPAAAPADKKDDKADDKADDKPTDEAAGADADAGADAGTDDAAAATEKSAGFLDGLSEIKYTGWNMIIAIVVVLLLIYLNGERVAGEILVRRNPALFKGCPGGDNGVKLQNLLSGTCGARATTATFKEPVTAERPAEVATPKAEDTVIDDDDDLFRDLE